VRVCEVLATYAAPAPHLNFQKAIVCVSMFEYESLMGGPITSMEIRNFEFSVTRNDRRSRVWWDSFSDGYSQTFASITAEKKVELASRDSEVRNRIWLLITFTDTDSALARIRRAGTQSLRACKTYAFRRKRGVNSMCIDVDIRSWLNVLNVQHGHNKAKKNCVLHQH
jgi:hypothetical protein